MVPNLEDRAQLRAFLDRLCDAAAAETLPRFRSDGAVENKLTSGFDPVTEADKQAEAAIRTIIRDTFPDHAITGEEEGADEGDAHYRWIIDPIDGTRAFVAGIPVWGTLIGLSRDDEPWAGAMDQPFTGERYLGLPATGGDAAQSIGIHAGQKRVLTTRTTATLGEAILMTTSPYLLQNDEDMAYFDLEKQARLTRYGCDCYAYSMVAAGFVDLVAESGLNSYDIAALIPIVEGAGGIVTTWDGGPALDGGQILAAANAELHERARGVLAN